MNTLRRTLSHIALLVLVVLLTGSVATRAHSLEYLNADMQDAAAVCMEGGHGDGHGSTDSGQSDVRCCDLDHPYDTTQSGNFDVINIEGKLFWDFTGRRLEGVARPIDIPPQPLHFAAFAAARTPRVASSEPTNTHEETFP